MATIVSVSSDYDVIIVGGRPAGATLAARLGDRGIRVLIVDRATFPSLPAVPSSPAIYPGAMALLDEIGIKEAAYGDDHARLLRIHMCVANELTVEMRVPKMAAGRDYGYGIDRIQFDDVLWRSLERYPSVERREGFHVTGLTFEGSRVTGIEGSDKDGPTQAIKASCVVGADGRFSFVARAAGAPVIEEADEHTSTVYYADWKGLAHAEEVRSTIVAFASAKGFDILMFPLPDGRYSVNTHARSDRVQINGDAQGYYLSTLRDVPYIWRFLEGAEQVTPLVGVKKISNGYRRSSGPGWALTGDAYHYKDPVDGQGIYDALLESKILDRALASFVSGARSWDDAMAAYDKEVYEATHPMFVATVGRLKQELYVEPSLLEIQTLRRWTLTDPLYQETFLRVLGRHMRPEIMSSRRLVAGAIARGIGRDVLAWARRKLAG